jgi:hypothetical protein
MQFPKTSTRSTFRLRMLAVAQALVLLVSLGVPIAATASMGAQAPNPAAAVSRAANTGARQITPNATAGTGTKLVITSVNGGANPVAGVAFSVTVQVQDGSGSPADVTAGTDVTLTKSTGTGTLGGTTAGTIAINTNSITISGVTWSTASTGVSLTATKTSGPGTLAAGTSGTFTVTAVPAATKLAITSINGGANPIAGTAFSVVVESQDASSGTANVTSDTGFTLSRNTGTGTLGGTVTGTIPSGSHSVTVTGVTWNTASTGVSLTATQTSGTPTLTAGNSATFTVTGSFTKLQILVPGETAAPWTTSGKTGTPTAQTAGAAFAVTVNAVDANWNVVSSTHTVGITSSDAGATLPVNATLVAGTKTFSVTLNTVGSRTVTATDITDVLKTANTSPAIAVVAGTFTKLQILVPGETAAPGTTTGKTGTPTTEGAGAAFNVIVNAVDANWNVVSSTHTVGITSSDAAATLPASAALVAGTKTFSVKLNTVGSRTVTATDLSDGTKTANTSPAITVVTPAVISLVRSTGMIAYGTYVGFSIQMNSLGVSRTVYLEHTYVGSSWATVATLSTNASGFVATTYPATRTGYYRVRFAGAADIGAAYSPVVLVGVRQTANLFPTHTGVLTIAKGRTINFRSTVAPLRPDLVASNVTFRFYQKVAGAWVLKYERHVAADTAGTARTTFTFGVRGTWYVMSFADRSPYNAVSRFSQRQVFLVH